MALLREEYYKDGQHFHARFYVFEAKKDAPMYRFCTVDEAVIKQVGKRRRRRAPAEKDNCFRERKDLKWMELQFKWEQGRNFFESYTETNKHTFSEAI